MASEENAPAKNVPANGRSSSCIHIPLVAGWLVQSSHSGLPLEHRVASGSDGDSTHAGGAAPSARVEDHRTRLAVRRSDPGTDVRLRDPRGTRIDERPARGPWNVWLLRSGPCLRGLYGQQFRSHARFERALRGFEHRTAPERYPTFYDRRSAHRGSGSGISVRFCRPILRGGSTTHLPGSARILHHLQLARGAHEHCLHKAMGDEIHVRNFLSSLRAHFPAGARNRRSLPAHDTKSAIECAGGARAYTEL